GHADAPLRRRDAPDRRGEQQHRLPGQLAELDQLGERQAALRDPPVHPADHRLPQAAPDPPPLAVLEPGGGRGPAAAEHRLARHQAVQADFSSSSRFLAWVLEAFETEHRGDVPIYVGTNAFWEPLGVELPPVEGKRWYRVVDTSLPEGEDIVPD